MEKVVGKVIAPKPTVTYQKERKRTYNVKEFTFFNVKAQLKWMHTRNATSDEDQQKKEMESQKYWEDNYASYKTTSELLSAIQIKAIQQNSYARRILKIFEIEQNEEGI